MRELTTLTAIGTLTSSLLGGGSLSLPYAFSHSGLIAGIISTLAIASFASISCNLLVASADKINSKSLDSLSKTAYGASGSIISITLIFLFCWLASVAFIMLISEHLIEVLPYPNQEEYDKMEENFNKLEMKFIVGCITFPLTTIRNLHGLRYTSIISISLMVILLFSIGVRSIEKGDVFTKDRLTRSPIKWWPDNLDSFTYSLSFIMSVYLCQFQIIPIFSELSKQESMSRVINITIAVVTCIYLFIAIFGYFYALDATCDTILHTFGKHDPYAQLARILLSISLFFSYPLNVLPCRASLIQILIYYNRIPRVAIQKDPKRNIRHASIEYTNGEEDSEINPNIYYLLHGHVDEYNITDFEEVKPIQLIDKYHYLITLLLVASIVIMASVLPTIAFIWGILGSTLSVAIAFFLPPLLYIKLHQSEITKIQICGLNAMIFIGICISVSSLASTLIHSGDPSCPE